MQVQQRILELMQERGWTEYRLAKEAGLSHSTVANLFKRNNAPSLPTLELLCQAFGLTLSQFFSREGEPLLLTPEQKMLLDKWNALPEEKRKCLWELLNIM